MTHIHLPDGVLPVWLWVLGFIIIGLYLLIVSFYMKKPAINKKISLIGILSALMLIVMSIEIIPPFYHINLAVLTGIILGPVLSVIAILVVSILLAFLGHGGITVIGLNTIVVSLEAVIGYFGFKLLSSKLKNVFARTFLSAMIALFVSTWATIGVVYLGTHNAAEIFEHHHDQLVTNTTHNDYHDNEDFDINKFIILVLSFGALGWIIESFLTAFIVSYIQKVNPSILEMTEDQA